MLSRFKKSLLITATVAMLFSSVNAVSAANVSTEDIVKNDTPISAVTGFLSSLDKNNYSDSINYWIANKSEEYSSFLKDPQNADSGLLSIKQAKLVESKELDYKSAELYTPYYDSLINEYNDVHFYYLSVNYKVSKENEMNMNGINYIIAAVVQENGEWKIAQYSVAPVDNIVGDNNGFNSVDESAWVKQYKERYKGNYLNRNGQVVKENKLSKEELQNERSLSEVESSLTELNTYNEATNTTLAVDQLVRPSTIKVKLMQEANWKYYNCIGIGCVKEVGFYYYVKNVLPNEWDLSSPFEAFRAGAMAVKMYGWFAVYNPLDPMLNYALNDGVAPTGTSKDQMFKVQSEITATTQAINSVDTIGMATGSVPKLFLARYAKGLFNGTFDAHTGELQQEGSRWWAQPTNAADGTVRNKNMYWILDYYYNYTDRVPDLVFFTY